MAFESLTSELSLDASGYVGEMEEAAGATDDLADSAGDATDSLIEIDAGGVAAGAGMAAAGTGAQGLLDDTQSLRESLGRTAVDMGITSDEANAMARSMSDATFSLEDVTGTMDALSRQGVETEEDMERLALASDNLADATGTTATSVAERLGPAVRGLDGDLSGLEENADAFTLAVRNTTLETEDLAMTMERSSDELKDMGLQSDEAAGLIAAYGEETGKSGRQLRRDFSAALREADGDMEAFAEETGLSEDVLEDWNTQLAESEGATNEYADAANESLSTWDSMRAGFEDAKLAASGMLGPVNSAAPALQSAGIAAMAMSTINFSAVIPSFIGVAAAAAPVVVPLAAIGAAVGALYLAWDNNIFGIRDIATDAFDTIMGIVDGVRDAFPGSLSEAAEMALDVFETWHPAAIIWRKRDEILDALPSASDAMDAATGFVDGFTDGIRDAISGPVDAVEDMAGEVRDRLPFSPAKEGPLSDLDDAGKGVGEELGDNMAQSRSAVASGANTMAGGASGSGGGGTDVEIRFTGGSDVDDALWQLLREHVEVFVDGRERAQFNDFRA